MPLDFKYDTTKSEEENFNLFVKLILNLTVMVVQEKPTEVFTYIGGALNVRSNKNYYLISAGHIFNLDLPTPGIVIGKKWIGLNKTILISSNIRQSEYYKYDFSVIRLNVSHGKAIENRGSFYLTLDDLATNHKIDESGVYFCAGLPITLVDKKSNFEFDVKHQFFNVSPVNNSKVYKRHQYSREKFILLKFRKKYFDETSRKRRVLKKFQGMSGSGLWAFSKGKFQLVGIMIEDRSDIGLLVAIRLEFFVSIIQFIEETDRSVIHDIFEGLPDRANLLFAQFK